MYVRPLYHKLLQKLIMALLVTMLPRRAPDRASHSTRHVQNMGNISGSGNGREEDEARPSVALSVRYCINVPCTSLYNTILVETPIST